ncbi:MAG: ABC transporter permease [Gaiellales bacterium]
MTATTTDAVPTPAPGGGDRRPAPGISGWLSRSPLLRYALRRIAWSVLLLAFVVFLTFLVFYELPSADPAQLRAGKLATPELVAEIRHKFGLDRPFYVQFWIYAKGVVGHFDLGYSYYKNLSVREEIVSRLPASISVALGAFVLWMLVAIPVGIIAALRPRSLVDRLATGFSLLAISAPTYWLGLVLLFLFAKDIGAFPLVGGAGTYVPISESPSQWLQSMIMPWIVLAAGFAAFYSRMISENLREVMAQDYVRTARAKGLSERRVIVRHGLRAALTPVVTLAGLDLGGLLGGTVLIESVFNIPGVGRYAIEAIQHSDLPAIQGTVLFGGVFIVGAVLVVDLLYAFLDPRVRY